MPIRTLWIWDEPDIKPKNIYDIAFLINYDDACFPFSLGGNVPNILHQVSVPIINNDKCQNMFIKSGHKKKVRESFLCAGYDKGEKDSCEVRILI